MKKTKILTLSAALLMAFATVGCDNSSQVAMSKLKDAATTLWTMYKDANNSYALGSYDVVKKITLEGGAYTVDVSWSLEDVQGTAAGIKLQENTVNPENLQTVYVGYYDFVVQEESSFKLVPTLSYNGVSKKMGELLDKDSKGNEKVFSRKAKKLVFNTYDEYIKIADKAGGKKDTNCVAAIKAYVTGISAKGQYVYLQDDAHGYMIYGSGYDTQQVFKKGDFVAVAGCVYAYSGCYEFVSATVNKIPTTDAEYAKYEMPTNYVDVTEAFAAAKDNKDTSLAKYQDMKVEIKGAKIDSVSGSNYNFTVGSKKVKYNLYWSTSYFLTKDENNVWAAVFEAASGLKSVTVDIKGVVSCYSAAHQIYPDTANCITVHGNEDDLAKFEQAYLDLAGYAKFYSAKKELTLPAVGYTDGSTITWALDGEATDVVKIEDGKLKINPVKTGDVVTRKLTATIKVGAKTQSKTWVINAKDIDEQTQAQMAAEELSDMSVPGALALPKTSDTFPATITWTLKDGTPATVKINNGNEVVLDKTVAVDTVVTAVAKVKVGSKEATKEIKLTAVAPSTIAEFQQVKDKKNEKAIRGVIVAKNAADKAAGSFVLSDGTNYMFSYNSAEANIGDEVVVFAKYSVNNQVDQLGTTSVIVCSTGNKVTLTPTLQLTAAQVAEKLAVTEDTDASKLAVFNELGGKVIEIEGYVVKSGDYYNMAATADATKCPVSIYSGGKVADEYKALVGKKVKAVCFYRGLNVKSGNFQFQLASVSEVK